MSARTFVGKPNSCISDAPRRTRSSRAHYLVRMLDGHIDTKGTTKGLRAQGVLDDNTPDAAVEVKKEELAVAKEVAGGDVEAEADPKGADENKTRKLIQDEHREARQIYSTISGLSLSTAHLDH
ncbi:hypothetical protein DFH08DRAFT_1054298 [Mycena albidolilacea]|uniref:Uncharacterized protein n=1 Tax=Mycena albidolilacea TaxID=1033008 RepID=A0AAD7E9Z9_9AGAR|nr:hypothetical protein DFH08DRAFT_1054298 [Mycena albidolilacea]